MTSPLPPKRRDSRNLADLIRQDRTYLKQIGVGFAGGRFSPARPLRPAYDSDDEPDEGVDNTTDLAAINTDRVTVTTAGIVTLPLTYVPLDGSLHVRWDGDDLHPSEWTLSGQSVIYADPHLHVGDVLTAAYFYYPSDVPGPPLAVTVSARAVPGVSAWGTSSGSGGGPPVPLPAGTQVGDLIVVSAISSGSVTISDSRLTFVGNCMWIGWATNLSDIPISFGGSPWYAVTCDTFATDASGWTAAQVSSSPSLSTGSTIPTPVVGGVAAAICASTATIFSFGACSIGVPTGYTNVADLGDPLASSINLWTADGLSTSPSGTLTYTGGGDGAIYATVVGLIGPADS